MWDVGRNENNLIHVYKLSDYKFGHLEKNKIFTERIYKWLDIVNDASLTEEEEISVRKIHAKYCDVNILLKGDSFAVSICLYEKIGTVRHPSIQNRTIFHVLNSPSRYTNCRIVRKRYHCRAVVLSGINSAKESQL